MAGSESLADAIAAGARDFETAASAAARGVALEQLSCALFGAVPGVAVQGTRLTDGEGSQELDVVLWNDRDPAGLWFLHEILLVECKNWERPVGSSEVAWFDHKVREAGLPAGFLVVANGLTGSLEQRTAAHAIIVAAQREGRRLITLELPELLTMRSTDAFASVIKRKLCELVAKRSIFRGLGL